MTSLRVNLEDSVKIAADNLFENYGLNTATAVKMFIYTAVRTNNFPFTFSNNAIDNETRQSLSEAMNDSLNRTNLSGPFKTAKAAIADMLKD